jgi:hypothetical protein
LTESFQRAFSQVFDLLPLTHVGFYEQGSMTAGRIQAGGHTLRLRLIDVRDDNIRAFRKQPFADGLADIRSTARYDGGLSL